MAADPPGKASSHVAVRPAICNAASLLVVPWTDLRVASQFKDLTTTGGPHSRKAEVSQLDPVVCRDQEVLSLEVAVQTLWQYYGR